MKVTSSAKVQTSFRKIEGVLGELIMYDSSIFWMRYDTNYGMDEVVFSVAWKTLDPYDYASFCWMAPSPLD